jgi:phosphoenolpyruvate---glycerone phosphotransferase subunit DhaL
MAEQGADKASSFGVVELIVRSMAQTAVDNEQAFCELDAVAGDGDFGFSLARGFEKVLEDFATLDRSGIGAFLKRVGLIITSKSGGTSGPIWGTAFLRAASAAGDRTSLEASDVVPILRAAFTGIQQRGRAELGDKTLLDSLGPFIDTFEQELASSSGAEALARAAVAAGAAAARTAELVARRGRAAYTGERSRGSPDPGATAVALMLKNIAAAYRGPGAV